MSFAINTDMLFFMALKKKVDEYLFNHKNQLELDFREENNVCGKSR